MPGKKKVVATDVIVTETIDAGLPNLPKVAATCGHKNRQFYNTDGRLQDLECDLPPKHKGDHHAKHQKKVPAHEYNNKGQVVIERYNLEDVDGYWGDAAGIPAREIVEKPMPQLSMYQKDLLAAVLSRNPDMPIEQAIEQARKDASWSVVS